MRLGHAIDFYNRCVHDKASQLSTSVDVVARRGSFQDFQRQLEWLPWRQYQGAELPPSNGDMQGSTKCVVIEFPALELLFPLELLQSRFRTISTVTKAGQVLTALIPGDITVLMPEDWNSPEKLFALGKLLRTFKLPRPRSTFLSAEASFVSLTEKRRRQIAFHVRGVHPRDREDHDVYVSTLMTSALSSVHLCVFRSLFCQ